MKIIINNTSMVPIYEQIMEQIKAQIISGELKENDILPSVRTMAKELKISALTVKKAYDNLEAEGMTVTVHGKGTYVAASNTQLMEEERRKEVETDLEAAIQKGRRCGMKEEEIRSFRPKEYYGLSVKAGDVTFTPDGKGHGLKNTGDTDLVFMALIIFD